VHLPPISAYLIVFIPATGGWVLIEAKVKQRAAIYFYLKAENKHHSGQSGVVNITARCRQVEVACTQSETGHWQH